MDNRSRLLAVEVLLCDPEELHDDPLEAELYVYRDRLRAKLADGGGVISRCPFLQRGDELG